MAYEKHGMTDTKEYRAWVGMRKRCTYKNSPQYSDWGGRGIKVCDEWMESFTAFYNYIGPSPSKSHSLDRIDNDGNYEPGNVRWATRAEQSNNQRIRRANKSGHTGVTFDKKVQKWQAKIKNKHVGYATDLEEAILMRKNAEKGIMPDKKYIIQKNNKTGVNGVSWFGRGNVWQVKFNSKYIGCSKNFEDACAMRKAAEESYAA